ncbi:hypothetical protein F4859DRAFT_471885 [Xylaria cf. heliscus]|nr:hypothetical protein F4859DRAFT_471885 [Xylaria cf. heliscus]
MDGYTSEANSWRRICLINEPIFCPAPSPSNPDDIICPGSDHETDEATAAARQRRYEEHGRRYLQGRPLRILSASLRGPFDQTSGWQNPWLPKPSSQHGQCLQDSAGPWPVSSASQCETGRAVSRLSSEQSNTDQDPYDSMECHLPSPQSHEDLQFFETPQKFESRSRIESWAKNVRDDILEEDKFWAPNRVSAERNVDSAKKHTADGDWLKRRPEKRRKHNASQSTQPTSTPTPLPITRPKLKNEKELGIGSRAANRSFEMTTPSSSPRQGPGKSPGSIERQAVTSYEEDEQLGPSTTSIGDSRISSEPPSQRRQEEEKFNAKEREHDEEQEEEEYEKEEVQTARASEMRLNRVQEQTSHNDGETGEAIDVQDYADESFCYQARHMKQPTDLIASNATVPDYPSPHIQTETPISPKHDHASMVSSNPSTQESSPNATCSHLDMNNAGHVEKRTGISIAATLNDESECLIAAAPKSDLSLPQYHERERIHSCGIIDVNAEANCDSKANAGQPLSDITSNQHASKFNIRNTIPHTILKMKAASDTNTEWFFDKGPTLIGDLMDTEELENIEPAHQDDSSHFKGTSLLQHYAISATNLADAGKPFQCGDITTITKGNDAANSLAATISQQGAAELQLRQIEPCSPNEEKANSTVGINAIINQDGQDNSELVAQDQTISVEQQSPWTALSVIDERDQLSQYNMKRAGDRPRELKAKATAILPKFPALVDCSPTILPSQQSPWVKGVAESAHTTRLEGAISMNAIAITDLLSPREFQTPSLLANQEHISRPTSSPAILPVPDNSLQIAREQQCTESDIVTEKETSPSVQDTPYTPIPLGARQPTPDGEVSIRSFSNFNFSSPPLSVCPPGSSTSRGIISNRKYPSTRTGTRSSRRVSFAPLPHEDEGNGQSSTKTRAASPPPPPLVDLEEEDIDERYRKHYNIMSRRLSVRGTPNLRYHQRLLPSVSQQKPESPSVEAMAEAFQEADAHLLDHVDEAVEGTEIDRVEIGVALTEEMPQSPWQHDSQGVDDVAAVMGNLHDFLDVWDVDTEMDRNRIDLDEAGRHEVPSNNDMNILQGVGIW